MLTTSDLQAIKRLIQDEGQNIRSDFDNKLGSMESKFDKKLKAMKSDIRQMKKDISVIVSSFNREDVRLHKRVTRIEKHLSLPPME